MFFKEKKQVLVFLFIISFALLFTGCSLSDINDYVPFKLFEFSDDFTSFKFQDMPSIFESFHTWLNTFNGGITVLIQILVLIFGLVNCFYGYKIFKVILFILGAVAGGFFVWGLVGSMLTSGANPTDMDNLWRTLGAVGGAIAGGVLAFFLYIIFVFLYGAGFGAVLGAYVASYFTSNQTVIIVLMIVFAFLIGALAIWLQKLLIMLGTAFSGGLLATFSVLAFFTATADMYSLLIPVIILTIVGLVFQSVNISKTEYNKDMRIKRS